MEFENILYEVRDGILYLTLNRPEVRNALSPEMWRDISAAVRQARLDDAVQVVVVTGAGDKALASGADIQELHDRYYMDQMIGTATTALKDLEDLYKPVICAVNGYALGGGCELTLACDLRIAADHARFALPEVTLGIIPGGGGTQRLARIIGVGRAKELIFTGDQIDAQEAYRLGLANHVVPRDELMETCRALGKKIASRASYAVFLAKTAINSSQEIDLKNGAEREKDLLGLAFATRDKQEGMEAFLARRPPRFQDF